MKHANLEVIQQRFPHVLEMLGSVTRIAEQKEEAPVYEQLERDEIWLQAVAELMEDSKILFVYGFGQGLSIADLLERFPDRWLFIYEPDEEAFKQVMSAYDISFLLNHPNLYWISVGESQLKLLFYLLCSYMQEKLAFVALRRYLEKDIDILRDVREEFIEYKSDFNTNKYTENRFRKEWTRNYLYHLSETFSTPSIERMFQSFKGSSAVVVSSGPSLTEDIEWIKKLSRHSLIIAAGSSVQALIRHGINPHLSVIMDGHEVNDRIFSNPDTLKSTLFFTSSSYYGISERKENNKIHAVLKNDEISQYFLQKHKNQLLMVPTPSVAGTALQVAVHLGAEKIIFAGQDLSYPNQKVYSDGVEHFSADITKTMLDKATQTVENVQGEYNATDSSFMFMKETIEGLIQNFEQITFINSTRHGAVIEGAPFQPMEEIYEEVCHAKLEPNAIKQWMVDHPSILNPEEITPVKDRLGFVQEDLLKVQAEIRVLRKLMSNIQQLSRTKPLKCQNLMVEIEERWGEIANREWFAPLYESLIPLELARFDRMLPTIVTEEQLPRKAGYIYEYLGTLLVDLEQNTPDLLEMVAEASKRVEDLLVKQA